VPAYREAAVRRAERTVIHYWRFRPGLLAFVLTISTVASGGAIALPFFAPLSDRPPWFGVCLWVVAWSSFLLWWVWDSLSHARVEVDRGEGTLTLTRVRWPLGEQRRVFPLSRVLGATVSMDDANPYADAAQDTLVLVVEGEGHVPLLGPVEPDRQRLEALAEAISAALPERSSDDHAA
jgi:hypothetical protein